MIGSMIYLKDFREKVLRIKAKKGLSIGNAAERFA